MKKVPELFGNEEKCKENNGRRTAYRIGTCIAYGISFNGSAATGSSIFAYAHTCITRRICFRTCVWIFCRIVFTDYKLCFDGYAGSRQIAVYDD